MSEGERGFRLQICLQILGHSLEEKRTQKPSSGLRGRSVIWKCGGKYTSDTMRQLSPSFGKSENLRV